MFFGLYGEMSAGISKLDFSVLLPLGIALLATFLLLSKVMKLVFDKFHSVVSHSVLGFVVATTLMILPFSEFNSVINVIIFAVCIIGGAIASFFFSKACEKIRASCAVEESSEA
jgi:putative membrane protein